MNSVATASGGGVLRRSRSRGLVRRISRRPGLIIGTAILVALLTAAFFPATLAPRDPEARGPAMQEIEGQWVAPPYPPSAIYPLGTDPQARDLLSRLIHGARSTLIIAAAVAIFRVVLGAGLGWVAAFYRGGVRRNTLLLASLSATIPSLLFAYLVIVTVGPTRGPVLFILAMGLTGWAPWTQMVYSGIQRIQAEEYMLASDAIGSTRWSQTRYYLLPNLLPTLIPVAASEAAASLLLLAELGFLGIFLGATRQVTMSSLLGGEQPILKIAEWGAMLAGTRLEIFNWWWLTVMPALAFALAIFGLHLLGDGLREVLDIDQSRGG
jgi:peptide/nickel transport system permease protein